MAVDAKCKNSYQRTKIRTAVLCQSNAITTEQPTPCLWILEPQGQLCQQLCFPTQASSEPAASRRDVWIGIPWTWRMHRIQVTDQTVTSVEIIHYILKSLDTKGPVALLTFSSCSCKPAQRNQSIQQFFRNSVSLYKHNHLPAKQTAGMTPVTLSLGKTHTHLVRVVTFTELFRLRQ